MTEIPTLLTPKEFAAIFRTTPSTVSRWISNGVIPSQYVVRPSGRKQGSLTLIKQKAVEALLTPVVDEHANIKHYKRRDDTDSYQRLLSRF